VQARESFQNRRRLPIRMLPTTFEALRDPPLDPGNPTHEAARSFGVSGVWMAQDGWPCGFRLRRRSEASGSTQYKNFRDPGHRVPLRSQDPGCGRGTRRSSQLGWRRRQGCSRVLSAPRLIDGDAREPLGRMLGVLVPGRAMPCNKHFSGDRFGTHRPVFTRHEAGLWIISL
jgi:hypothetical protein